jgi:hypothetical protein
MNIQNGGLPAIFSGILGLNYDPTAFESTPSAVSIV